LTLIVALTTVLRTKVLHWDVYTRFSLVPKSMTLSDPSPGFQGHGRQNLAIFGISPANISTQVQANIDNRRK